MAEATLSVRGMPGYLGNKTLQLDDRSNSCRDIIAWERRQLRGPLPTQSIRSFKSWELLDIKLLFSWDRSCYCVLQLEINAEKKVWKEGFYKILKDILFIRDRFLLFMFFLLLTYRSQWSPSHKPHFKFLLQLETPNRRVFCAFLSLF